MSWITFSSNTNIFMELHTDVHISASDYPSVYMLQRSATSYFVTMVTNIQMGLIIQFSIHFIQVTCLIDWGVGDDWIGRSCCSACGLNIRNCPMVRPSDRWSDHWPVKWPLTGEVTTDRLDEAEVIEGEVGDPHHGGGVVVGHHGGTEELAETARGETDVEDDTVVDGQTHQLGEWRTLPETRVRTYTYTQHTKTQHTHTTHLHTTH